VVQKPIFYVDSACRIHVRRGSVQPFSFRFLATTTALILGLFFLNQSTLAQTHYDFSLSVGSSGAGNGQFNFPLGVAVDAGDNLWVTDTNNNRIQKFTGNGVFLGTIGSTGSGSGQFRFPFGIAFDTSGNVLVADSNNDRIQRFNSNGSFLGQFGSTGAGNGQMRFPAGVAVDKNGNIWISDVVNSRLEKFNSSGSYLAQFANGQFVFPRLMTITDSGIVLVTDANNNRVAKFDLNGNSLGQIGGTMGSGDGQLNGPHGVIVDKNGNVLVADTNNQRIQIFDINGTYLGQFGSFGAGNGQFNFPVGLALDSTGNLWVADASNNRIQKFTPTITTPQPVYQINGGGSAVGSFVADTFVTGGSIYAVGQTIDTTGVTNAAPAAVYQSLRFGNFFYNIPTLTPGTSYTVRLHFAETYFATAGNRVFNVAINGTTVLSSLDVAATVGPNKALVKEFTASADSAGKINITFVSVVDNAIVNGIEILSAGVANGIPTAPSGLTASAGNAQITLAWNAVPGATSYKVYRSTTSGSGYAAAGTSTATSVLDTGLTNGTTYYYVVTAVNTTGESPRSSEVSVTPQAQIVYQLNSGGSATGTFAADNYVTGGAAYIVSQTISTAGVTQAAPAAVYQSLRYGTFFYDIPALTAGTSYTVRLHFAETYFTTAGSRVFNVAINSTPVLTNFDIIAVVGPNKALVREFTAVADANGKINIAFSAVVDHALVNGIEIIR
jgi:sugar lactone lactonase YvrE